MRLVAFSDLHAHPFTQYATTLPSGRNSRLQNTLNVLEEITAFCQSKKVDVLVFCGDLFHSRTKIDVDCHSSTWLAMRELCHSVKHAFLLRGNHDTHDRLGRVHSLEAFREFATVVDLPLLTRVDGLQLAFHPFTERMEEWHSFVSMLPNDLDFFFAHQGVSEATIGAFDISIKAEVSYADLPHDKAKWCLFGHYHAAQWLGAARRVGYIGSPIQHNMGERTEEKGFLYFDTEQGLGCNSAAPEFVKTRAPKFILVDLSGDFSFTDFWHNDVLCNPQAIRDNFVRVTGCTVEEARQLKEVFPQIQIEITRETQEEERRIDKEALTSDRTLLESYIEQSSVDNLDQDRLLSLGLDLLEEQ